MRVFFDPVALRHDTGPHHPENKERLAACLAGLEKAGAEVSAPESPARTLASVEKVHVPGYVRRLSGTCAMSPPQARDRTFSLFDSPDNPISRATFQASLRTAGLGLAAVDSVLEGGPPVFVSMRPPGHHALAEEAMGFCFLNGVAIAARDLVENAGATRVLIADFDVHHGNGTQDIFWEDGRVAYLSVHRSPFYPYSGAVDEEGEGKGRGTTRNVPIAGGASEEAYVGGFLAALESLAERFRPEFVLVSAGFDAHRSDPLGGMNVTEHGFFEMTRRLRDVADVFARGRVVSFLEGGYDPDALAASAVAHLRALQRLPEGASD